MVFESRSLTRELYEDAPSSGRQRHAIETANAIAEATQATLIAAAANEISAGGMMPRMEIRTARDTDAEAMADQMWAVAAEGLWIATQTDRSVDALAARFRSALEDGHILLVLEHEGRIIGSAGIHPTAIEGVQSLGMSILKEFRGQGWGGQLIDAALDAARRRGVFKVELEVFTDNARAIALYISSGFEIEGHRRHHYPRLDGSRRSALLMARFL